MSITLNTRCDQCGTHLELDDGHKGHVVHCPRCLDPEGEGPELIQGKGNTPEDALQNWYDKREELGQEPEYHLSDLASFVVPKHGGAVTIGGLEFESLALAERWSEDEHGQNPIYYQLSQSQKAANDT